MLINKLYSFLTISLSLLLQGCALSSNGFGNSGINRGFTTALGSTTGAIIGSQIGGTSMDRALSGVGGAVIGGAIGSGFGGSGCCYSSGTIIGSSVGAVVGSQIGGSALDRALMGVGGSVLGGWLGDGLSAP